MIFDAECPECEWTFKIEKPIQGEIVACDDCGLNMLVESMDEGEGRVVLQLTENEADDWGE